jgi:N,N'-diacetyllegionaminate synthase
MKKIEIDNKSIGENSPVLIIAEIASSHEGNFSDLIKLIDFASKTGADAVKFQVLNAEAHMTSQHQIWGLVKQLEFSKEQWIEAALYTRKNTKMLMLTDVYDIRSIETVFHMKPDMIKIHSADLNNFELVAAVAKLGIPTMIGVGASTLDEITNSIKVFKNINTDGFLSLMHGYQGFPTSLEDMNIRQLCMIRDIYNLPVGFLDHTEGDTDASLYIPLVAASLGAFAIEKHICLDRALKGIDHESSLSLRYFKKLVNQVRNVEIALGSQNPTELSEGEIRYRKFMKKGLVAAVNIKEGEVLSEKNIAMKRSEGALQQDELRFILGKKVKINLVKDDNISWEVIS